MSQPVVPHFLAGQRLADPSTRALPPLHSPVDGSPLGVVHAASTELLNRAVQSANTAFHSWSQVPIKERVQVLYRFKTVATQVSAENGKTVAEAAAGIQRGIEIVEYAASLPALFTGELLEVSTGVDCYTRRFPLGVVAGITPFNFPAMVPLWMFPMALACGNAFLLKPSEQVPFTPLLLGELLREAGLPDGLFQVIQGDRETVEAVLDHPGIVAAAFVGSTAVAKAVFDRGHAAGKRMLTLGGAKNHLVIVPDADPLVTARNVVSSAVGCAGQRCMAASVVIAVGDCEPILDAIEAEMRKLQCGCDVGAIISQRAQERIEGYIARAVAAGARARLDGRGAVPAGREGGHYVGPTLLDGVSPDAECAHDEIFGPVLTILRVATLAEALAIENRNPYGNAACIYTTSGATARHFELHAEAGMIGVNIGVPVPRDPFGFGGWHASKFGVGDVTGRDALGFWTKTKKITVKWTNSRSSNWMS
jgi:malonate-semialdehyde dehydrogenase (acetylating)/methylmalonate-semialdehyde dehydrogenase